MGNLIVPANSMPPYKEEFRISADAVTLPPALKEDFALNSHLEPVFYQSVAKALNETLRHPETKLREVTEQALKERIQLCCDTVVVLRYDMKYSLRKALDLLPKMMLRALIEGKNPIDLFERDAQGNAWGRGNPRRVVMDREELKKDDLTEEAARYEPNEE